MKRSNKEKMSESAIPTDRPEVRVPRFRSLKRAEEWCEKYFGINDGCCSFDGCDIYAINPTIRQLVFLSQEFPEAAQQFQVLGTCLGVSDSCYIASVHPRLSGMNMNPAYYEDAFVLWDTLQTMEREWHSPEGCGTIEYMATHEFAHAVEIWLTSCRDHVSICGYSGRACDVFTEWLQSHQLSDEISVRAGENHHEWFAEAFSSCYHSPSPLESAREVLAFVREITRQIRAANSEQDESTTSRCISARPTPKRD